MEKIFYRASRFSKIWISVLVAIVYTVLLIVYQRCIQGLEKPAGLGEAIAFLFDYPSSYAAALCIGVALHIITAIVIIAVILCFIGILLSLVQFDVTMIVNLVLGIIMVILNAYFARYVMSLVLAVVIIGGIGWALVNSDN